MILFIRTDSDEAEVGLIANGQPKAIKWKAGRALSQDIHKKLSELLDAHQIGWQDLSGIVYYEGPGSFTGLRIGAAVANALSSELDVPMAQASGEDWIESGAKQLKAVPAKRLAVPNYGRPPRITKPRK